MTSDTMMVHVRVSKKVKEEAQEVARSLGVPLSLVAEQAFRRFTAERRLLVEESFTPTAHLKKILKEAQANKGNVKFWSGPFASADEMEKHARSLMRKK